MLLFTALFARTAPLRQRFVNALLSGVHINTNVSFGEHSIRLENDKINFSADQTASAAGDFCYDTGANRLVMHDGTGEHALAIADEVLALSGGTMTGNIDMDSNSITGLPNAATGSSAAVPMSQLESYVGALIANKVDVGSVGQGLIGSASSSECNALSPVAGNVIVAEASYTPTAGTSDALSTGDVAEFDGTSWKKIVTNSAGKVPSGTRLLVSTVSDFISGGGLTDATDEGKIANFDGTSLTPTSFTTPSDGVIVAIKGEGATAENSVLAFDGAVPTGAWRSTAAAGVAHSSLTGLTSGDDHTQYVKLAGRSGGQTLQGGTAANNNLVLESTSNGTKGDIRIASGSTLKFMGDDVVTPNTDGQVSLGTSGAKFKQVYANTIVQGDSVFGGYGYQYRLQETAYGLRMLDQTGVTTDLNDKTSGTPYRMLRVPENIGPVRRLALRALGVQ